VYTKPNQEEIAKENLERQGVKVFLPLISRYKSKNNLDEGVRTEALFPRYLFIKINPYNSNFSYISSTRGVTKLVIFGDLSVSSVSKEIIKQIKNLLGNHDIFKEKIIRKEYIPGDKLTIKKGSAKGLDAIFLSNSGKNRVKILIQIINRSISADLHVDDIGKKEIVKTIKLTK